MKKILLAIFLLISVISYSQTTGYLRYDTVRVQRGGGNSTLVIENATRALTNGFLQNYAEGRTKFAYALDSVWIDGDSIRFRYGTTTLAVLLPASYTDADARSAISLTTTGTSGAATYNSGTGVLNIPVYAGTLNANVGAFYRWLKPATQEIKTFAEGYGFLLDSAANADALTATADTASSNGLVSKDRLANELAAIDLPNLIIQYPGTGENVGYDSGDTLYIKKATGINGIDVTTVSDGLQIAADTVNDIASKDWVTDRIDEIPAGGGSAATGEVAKTIYIASPTAADDITYYYTDSAIVVTKVADVLTGSSPSVTYNVFFASTRNSGSPDSLFSSPRAATSITGATTTTFNDNTIPAGSWIWLKTYATSGTVNDISVNLLYPGAGGGGGSQFSMNVFTANNATMTDGATTYFGYMNAVLSASATAFEITIDRNCTLEAANIESFASTAGSNEAWSMYVRVNNTTDHLIESLSSSSSNRRWDNNALAISLSAGDKVVIKSVAPTWATNPATTVLFGGYLVFSH